MKSYYVENYGIKANETELQTEKVQKLVDLCYKNGGGKIVFTEGTYVLSTIFLHDNIHIEVSQNATILGSLNFYDFAQQEEVNFPIYQDASHTYFNLSLFVAKNCKNISFTGEGIIDMRSVWDEDGVRGEAIKHRGPKCITLKECKNVLISDLTIINVTDLAIYFTACKNVEVAYLKLKVYIDGISPDNSRDVYIHDCDVETGDDGIVFKSSYNMNKIGYCKKITVENCKIKSRCNALKFGTETNGGFKKFKINNIQIRETRITGISIESVDGAVIKNINIKNVQMQNVNAPLFIHVGKRMRGPEGRKIGKIKKVKLENILAKGPYEPYEIMPWNYFSYKQNDTKQYPWIFGIAENFDDTKSGNTIDSDWQMTSNICGLAESPLRKIKLKNIHLGLHGGVTTFNENVPEEAQDYPEVFVYGRILPAKGIFFRHVKGLKLENVSVSTDTEDKREPFVFRSVEKLKIK